MANLRNGLRWSVLALCAAIAFSSWIACTSTETGNPPVVDPQRLAFRVVADAIEVNGEAGAVLPGGSTVEFAGPDQVVVISVRAAADGSFQVTIPLGTLEGLSIRAIGAGGGSEWQRAPTQPAEAEDDVQGPARAGTPDAAADLGMGNEDAAPSQSTCGELNANVSHALREALAGASSACKEASDCMLVRTRTSCLDSCDAAVARSDAAVLSAAITRIEAELCAEHIARSCAPGLETCPSDEGSIMLCIDGRCEVAHDGPSVIETERL